MLQSKYKWITKANGIIKDKDIFPQLLKNRQIDDYKTYFSLGEKDIIDPYKLRDMEKAKSRILKAIENNEKIMIYGDYDCDGISSISVLYRTLKQLNAEVYYDLPNRFLDGYGLNMRAVEVIKEMNIGLVITVDNGVTCFDEIEKLNEYGIDTIITDHHQFNDKTPNAYAILHTHISNNYEFKEIAGVMVAFKLSMALIGDLAFEYIDLVMIGTIADLMPLKSENQAIVNLGLEKLKHTNNLGLRKLIEYSDLDIINVTAISFKIAPKINSSGRLGKALEAVKLLVTDDPKIVNEQIIKIEKNHKSRKKLTEESFKLAEQLVNPTDQVIVVSSDKLHEGVLGICAQKIVEKYQRSAIVLTIDQEGIAKGSMRSFGNQNILNMLHVNKDLLLRYGGHSQAAGLQIEAEKLDLLKKGLNEISLDGGAPVLEVDMEVDVCNITIDTVQDIQDKSFFTATYLVRDLVVSRKQILGSKHTKLILNCHGHKFDALHFNSLEYYYSLENGDKIDMVVGLNVNNYNNRKKIQLMIKDISCESLQVLDFRSVEDYKSLAEYVIPECTPINDLTLLDNNLDEIIKNNFESKTYLITPRELNINLNKLITRRELGKIYQMLKEIKEFRLELLLRRLEYDKLILNYAIKIFLELKLIDAVEDYYIVNESALKTDLQNSPTYVKLEGVKKEIDFIYLDYLSHIKSYIKNHMEEL